MVAYDEAIPKESNKIPPKPNQNPPYAPRAVAANVFSITKQNKPAISSITPPKKRAALAMIFGFVTPLA